MKETSILFLSHASPSRIQLNICMLWATTVTPGKERKIETLCISETGDSETGDSETGRDDSKSIPSLEIVVSDGPMVKNPQAQYLGRKIPHAMDQ